MNTLHMVILVFHVVVGVMIIGLVLVQRGKGAETGAAFGSGASATVFGAKGSANFLSRSTAVLAAIFFSTSLGLAYLGSERPVAKSIIEQPATSGTPAASPAPGGEPASTSELPTAPEPPSGAPTGSSPPVP